MGLQTIVLDAHAFISLCQQFIFTLRKESHPMMKSVQSYKEQKSASADTSNIDISVHI